MVVGAPIPAVVSNGHQILSSLIVQRSMTHSNTTLWCTQTFLPNKTRLMWSGAHHISRDIRKNVVRVVRCPPHKPRNSRKRGTCGPCPPQMPRHSKTRYMWSGAHHISCEIRTNVVHVVQCSPHSTKLFAAPLRNQSVFPLVSVWDAQV